MSGFEAVMVFLVLSGFVLSLPRVAGSAPAYSHFLTRRLLRLWPAYAVAVVVAALLHGVGPASSGILAIASVGMLVAGSHALTILSSPFWSLIHEARVSAVFPLMVRVSCSWVGCTLVAAMWLAVCLVLPPLPGQLDMTLLTLPAFVAGIRLAYRRWRPRMSARAMAMTGLAGVYLTHAVGNHLAWTVPVDVFAAVMFVLAALRSPTLLRRGVPQYLGRISYSLYLLHEPLIVGVRDKPALIPVAVVGAFVLADLSQRFIEAPAIKLGRSLPDARPAPMPAVAVQVAE
jgi:peptidoglycan/LPS O-acetylase OafA/YrhL